jgi:mono/diheme cytochrome c family protein
VRPLLALFVALSLAVAAAGCGREHNADLVNGKELFVQKCASCHALDRANANGVVGPDLDEAFDAARADGFNEKTVEGIVQDQIANVRRNSEMPANLVVGTDAQDVAAYVAAVAGRPGQDQGILAAAGQPEVSKKPVKAENGTLNIDANPTGALAFTAINAIAPPGQLELVMKNPASIQHNIAVKDGSIDEKGPIVGQGGTSRVSADVKPGKYIFYCSVPGHEAGGMKGNLTVK